MAEIKFSDDNFESEVLGFEGPVLVDFFADWCGPCQMQGPIVEALANDLEGKNIKVGKLNVDENPKMSEKFEIMSIPTLIIFKDGQVKETLHGVHGKDDLKDKLEALV
ncbi:MAG: thioredoxin [Patescibacteria group bacterium]